MESVEELNNPNLKDRASRADQLRPLISDMDNVRRRFNTRLLLDNNDSALVHEYLDSNTRQVRDDIFDVLVQVSPVNQTGPLDHYHSMGLEFIPENTDQTHPLIQVRKEMPNNPIPEKPVLVLIRDVVDDFYRETYNNQHASDGRNISLFKLGSIEKQMHTRKDMIDQIRLMGRLPITETIKVHETAHCGNSCGFDYQKKSWNIIQEMRQQIIELRRSRVSQKMHELHSMISEYCLTGQNSIRDLTVASVREMAKYSMLHPHVSGYKNKKLEAFEITKMVKSHLDGKTKDLPDWYKEEYEKAEITLRNVFRTIAVEKTLGEAGTVLGRQKNKESMVRVKGGRMVNWEKRIVRAAKRKGIIDNDLSFEDALSQLDVITEDTIESLDQCALQVQFSLFAGVAASVSKIDGLSDKTRDVVRDARRFIAEAKNVGT